MSSEWKAGVKNKEKKRNQAKHEDDDDDDDDNEAIPGEFDRNENEETLERVKASKSEVPCGPPVRYVRIPANPEAHKNVSLRRRTKDV